MKDSELETIKGNRDELLKHKCKPKGFIQKNIVEITVALLLSLLFSRMITSKLFFIGYVPSGSMNPTLEKGDRIFVNVMIEDIERGKVYVFENEGELMVKRCIAIGGDTIKIDNNDVYINGELISEPYIGSENIDKISMDLVVPQGKYFFLGDNRGNSYDSRYWNNPFIDKSDINGECKTILTPINRFKHIN